MRIGGLQKCSTIDFPGRIACVIFTQGCGLDCFYCHNRPLIETNARQTYDESLMWDFLKRRVGKLDGVVISGGEPTMQPDLAESMYLIKGMGYDVKLDTNGQSPKTVEGLIEKGFVDYLAVDLKASPAECARVCGSENAHERAKETIELAIKTGVDFEVRTTLYPGLDTDGLMEILRSVPQVPRYRLNYFRMPEVIPINAHASLKEHALTKGEIKAREDELRALQKNLII